MTNSQKSNAEIETEEALTHMNSIIQSQPVKVQDAEYLVETCSKILYKCSELRKSRDNWRDRAEQAEAKLK